jgi:hypothetical protein
LKGQGLLRWSLKPNITTVTRLLAYVTGLVNQELLLKNEYLPAENSILKPICRHGSGCPVQSVSGLLEDPPVRCSYPLEWFPAARKPLPLYPLRQIYQPNSCVGAIRIRALSEWLTIPKLPERDLGTVSGQKPTHSQIDVARTSRPQIGYTIKFGDVSCR